jgi:hypothetical protein
MRDYSGYTGGEALHGEIAIGMNEMAIADEEVFTSMVNHIEASDNVAYSKGQIAIVKALNAGKTESEADADMQAAIDEYFAKIQENILEHWDTQSKQLRHHYDEVVAHTDLSNDVLQTVVRSGENLYSMYSATNAYTLPEILFTQGSKNDVGSGYMYESISIELLDGRTFAGHEHAFRTDSSNPWGIGFLPEQSDNWPNYTESNILDVGISPTDAGDINNPTWTEVIFGLDCRRYRAAWTDLITTRDNVKADLSGYVTDVYAAYDAGEVDLTDILDPITLATELATDNNYRAFRESAASQLGIPTDAEHNVVIDVHLADGDERLWVDMFTDHQPTDVDGNAVSWKVGETYSPSTWAEPLFIIMEKDDGQSDITKLEDDFTIVEAYNDAGDEVTDFDNRQTTTHTSDATKLKEELAQLREEQLRLIEVYSELDDGSGGTGASNGILSWLDDNLGIAGIPGRAVGLGVAAGVGGYLALGSKAASGGTTIITGKDKD